MVCQVSAHTDASEAPAATVPILPEYIGSGETIDRSFRKRSRCQ